MPFYDKSSYLYINTLIIQIYIWLNLVSNSQSCVGSNNIAKIFFSDGILYVGLMYTDPIGRYVWADEVEPVYTNWGSEKPGCNTRHDFVCQWPNRTEISKFTLVYLYLFFCNALLLIHTVNVIKKHDI